MSATLARLTPNWTNWPTADNNYVHPGFWWQTALLMITEIEPAM